MVVMTMSTVTIVMTVMDDGVGIGNVWPTMVIIYIMVQYVFFVSMTMLAPSPADFCAYIGDTHAADRSSDAFHTTIAWQL